MFCTEFTVSSLKNCKYWKSKTQTGGYESAKSLEAFFDISMQLCTLLVIIIFMVVGYVPKYKGVFQSS